MTSRNIPKPGQPYDYVIIGAGAGGLVFASVAGQLGLSVLLVERAAMGGDCLNHGCVPSKSLLAAGHVAHVARTPAMGVSAREVTVDHAKVRDHVRGVIAAIAHHDSEERFESLGCHVIKGTAKFVDPDTIDVDGQRYRARRFIISTGSQPFVPPIPGLKDVSYWTNETIFSHAASVDHLIVVGGGAIGCEMAQAWRRLGARVTLLEGAPSILGKDDPACVDVVRRAMRDDGIDIREHTKVQSVNPSAGGGVTVTVERTVLPDSTSPSKAGAASQPEGSLNPNIEQISGSHLLVAVGRRPNIANLGLDEAKIAYTPGGIKVDAHMRTTNRKVYAIGDANGGMMFTHVAGYEAGIAIANAIFRTPRKADYRAIPWVTFTDPELAHVGLTAAAAEKSLGASGFRTLSWKFADNDRAQTERRTEGMITIVTSPKGQVLGASIVGPHAGEMIVPWVMMVGQRQRISAMLNVVFPYPIMGEVGKRAVSSFYSPRLFSPLSKTLTKFLRLLP